MQLKLLTVFLILPGLVLAQDSASGERNPLFQNDEVLKAVLTAPISQAYAQRRQEVRIYFPGQWTYIDEDGKTKRLEVSIRTRGHFRRELCDLPPLQLNFKKSQVEGTLFAGQDKVKLVAPCKRSERYKQYVILEYLAYRIFELLTDHSFSTRLVRLSYVDRDEKLDPWTDFAFMIEDDSDLAKRLGLDRLEIESVLYRQLDHPRTALVQMFQFLIANNDYSLIKPSEGDECCHNIQLLGIESEDGSIANDSIIPIPYDFDFSGLVDAIYAVPPTQIPIRDVRSRYYYGLCQPRELIDAAFARVQSKKPEILALIENSAELDDALKRRNIAFIEEYFELFEDERRIRREVEKRCRGEGLMLRHFGDTTD